MKLTWECDVTLENEVGDVYGWAFVDLQIPDPIFNKGYGSPVMIMTRSKTLKKKPTDAELKSIYKELKSKLVAEFRTAARKLKV